MRCRQWRTKCKPCFANDLRARAPDHVKTKCRNPRAPDHFVARPKQDRQTKRDQVTRGSSAFTDLRPLTSDFCLLPVTFGESPRISHERTHTPVVTFGRTRLIPPPSPVACGDPQDSQRMEPVNSNPGTRGMSRFIISRGPFSAQRASGIALPTRQLQ
jgi:hypothetical protein